MLKAGDILRGRYRIERHIKKGGMGSVYEALDNNLGNKIAIKYYETIKGKFSPSTTEKLKNAFEREARLLSKLRHPNLPIATDYFEEGNSQYLVMDYIDGEDLQQQLQSQATPFSVEQVLEWAEDLLDTLMFLHGQEKPLIHRDIKPANLKLTPSGKIMLLDFGLAKGGLPGESGDTVLRGHTRRYASPEQMAGEKTDQRSDLYALSATLYYLLTAKRPIDAKLRQSADENNLPEPLKPANELNPKVPVALAKVLASAMALNPTHRPASAAQMRIMLKEAVELEETILLEAPPPSRSKWLPLAAIALLLALLAIFATDWVNGSESTRLPTEPTVAVVSETQTIPSLTALSPTITSTPTSLPLLTTTASIAISPTPEVENALANTPSSSLSPTTAESNPTAISPTVTLRSPLTAVITTPMPTVTEVQSSAEATEPSPPPPSSTAVVPPTIPTMMPSPTEGERQLISPTAEPIEDSQPTYTPVAVAVTDTPVPATATATYTPVPATATATYTPVPAPAPATFTPIPASPTNTATAVPTSTPTIAREPANLSRVSLLSPANEVGFNEGSEITFEWSWNGTLEGNAAPTYRLVILKYGVMERGFDTGKSSYTWQSDLVREEYEWYVVVLNAGMPIEQTKPEWNNKFSITGGGGGGGEGTPPAATIPP